MVMPVATTIITAANTQAGTFCNGQAKTRIAVATSASRAAGTAGSNPLRSSSESSTNRSEKNAGHSLDFGSWRDRKSVAAALKDITWAVAAEAGGTALTAF
jgi:hypothetical protein